LKKNEDKELEKRAPNFEPYIHYVVEQKIATQGIKMSKGVERILIIK
jgi:hypothetical protein